MAEGSNRPCGKLPQAIDRCKACGHGIKFARGWTWLELRAVFPAGPCWNGVECGLCPLNLSEGMGERAGLLWCGEKFYKNTRDWIQESEEQGISRRIKALPREFEIGKTWVLMAHQKAIEAICSDCVPEPGQEPLPECKKCEGKGRIYKPGIFHLFRPSRVEYVVKGGDSEEKLERLANRGIRLVRVEREEGRPKNPLDYPIEQHMEGL